jgi:ADP-ribose pyrophosphatase YjhB (NUDIX family)
VTEPDVPRLDLAAALILDEDRRVLWTWNPRWGAFAWPMTKVRPGESPRLAAERAGALGVPVIAGTSIAARPDLQVSDRDQIMKVYVYHIFRVEAHSRFAALAQPTAPHVWLITDESLSPDVRPLTTPCVELTGQLVNEGLLLGRSQLTSTLVVTRGPANDRRFLLRWNPAWGYTLPAKRRNSGDDTRVVARRVASDELGLDPSALRLAPAHVGAVTMRDESPTAEVPTFYVHALFQGTPADGARMQSSQPLIWASAADIIKGHTEGSPSDIGGGPAPAGRVSRTASKILDTLGAL